MFTIKNIENSVVIITIIDTIILDDLKKILGVLTRVFSTKKPFAFVVNCNVNQVPSEIPALTKYLVNWMKESHQDIIDYLQGSSIIIKSDILATVINGVFKIRGPIKPNYITTNYKLGEIFVVDIMKKYFKDSERNKLKNSLSV
jgi:hypothetical protein